MSRDGLVLTGGRIVTPDGVLSPGWIRLAGDLIDAVGPGDAPGGADADLRGRWVLPGFVDLHVHGGGGASFTDGTAAAARQAAAFHRGRGTTTMLASLVTAPLEELESRSALLAGLAAEDLIAGLHLEGPFLSRVQCGAQDPRYLMDPDPSVFERLHAAARGQLRILTLAPELPGATEVIQAAVRAGVTVAVGHTDATAEATLAAIDAGATHATHLFNAMRRPHHREPGPAVALLDRNQVTCEVIADGVHLHDLTVRHAARAAGRAGSSWSATPWPRPPARRTLPPRTGAGHGDRGSGPPGRRHDRRVHHHPGRRGTPGDRCGTARPGGRRRREHHPGPPARPR